MNYIFNYLVLLIISWTLFAFIPKFIYSQVKSLLSYNSREDETIKRNFGRTIKSYLVLGVSLGFVFVFLLKSLVGIDLQVRNDIELALLSFSLSFSLVLIMRISTLLSKSNILSKLVSKEHRKKLTSDSDNYPYGELKAEVSSFLFSIFLTAIMSLVVYFFYNILFRPNSIIHFSFSTTNANLGNYLLFIIVFATVLIIGTLIGEYCLYKFKVRPKM